MSLACWSLLVALGCQPGERADSPGNSREHPRQEVYFHGAASAQDCLQELWKLYAETHDTKIIANFGSSAALAQQIAHGAPADLLLSASPEWVDLLQREGLVHRRGDLLGNRLVVIVPRDSQLEISNLDQLATAEITHLALADPDSVPVGKYAKVALQKAGAWERLAERVALGADARQALTFVERGEAEAGIVYSTDAATSTAARVILEVPDSLTPPIVYPLALLRSREGATAMALTSRASAAEALYEFLSSPAAAAIFAKHGFQVLSSPE